MNHWRVLICAIWLRIRGKRNIIQRLGFLLFFFFLLHVKLCTTCNPSAIKIVKMWLYYWHISSELKCPNIFIFIGCKQGPFCRFLRSLEFVMRSISRDKTFNLLLSLKKPELTHTAKTDVSNSTCSECDQALHPCRF